MKSQRGKDVIRTCRKHTKKLLADVNDQDGLNALMSHFNDDRLKNLLLIYDQLSCSKPDPVRAQPGEAGFREDDPNEVNSITSSHAPLLLAVDTAQGLLDDLYASAEKEEDAMHLLQLLSAPHIRALLEVYDSVTQERYLPVLPPVTEMNLDSNLKTGLSSNTLQSAAPGATLGSKFGGSYTPMMASRAGLMSLGRSNRDLNADTGGDAPPGYDSRNDTLVGPSVKMVGIKKEPGEELGITVTRHDYYDEVSDVWISEIAVERILHGSRIDRQGLLHVGDIIREVNGVPIDSPETLQKMIIQSHGNITLKVIPAFREKNQEIQLFLRAHFSYDPHFDQIIPTKEAGLAFEAGDVLQVLDQSDPNWWQAKHFGDEGRAGLIPSWTLQERRRAFSQSARDPNEIRYKMMGWGIGKRKKKVKTQFRASEADQWEKSDVVVYEEVARIPGFQRKVISLVGPPSVGRRTLKNMLLRAQPDRYAVALPHTSRPKRDNEVSGEHYYFANRADMEVDIRNGLYVEVGEFGGHLYGTKLDTIRSVCKAGRTCLMDCSMQALRSRLRTAEFMPYVVFVAAPSVDCQKAMYEYGRSMQLTDKYKRDEDFRNTTDESIEMERSTRHLFDFTIVNDNMEVTFELLQEQLDRLLTEPQWIPIKWVY